MYVFESHRDFRKSIISNKQAFYSNQIKLSINTPILLDIYESKSNSVGWLPPQGRQAVMAQAH